MDHLDQASPNHCGWPCLPRPCPAVFVQSGRFGHWHDL